jgi:hypothetical protein
VSVAGAFVVPGRYRSIARSVIGGTVTLTGSLKITAFAGMVIVDLPLKVSARPDAVRMASSRSRSAMCAPPIVTGAVPYALVRTTRVFDPPMVVCTICRRV